MKTTPVNPSYLNLLILLEIGLHFIFPVGILIRSPFTYAGLMIIFLGIAIALGSLITFVFPVILFSLLNWRYIPHEEMRLEKIFGDDYRAYKHRVRRWL